MNILKLQEQAEVDKVDASKLILSDIGDHKVVEEIVQTRKLICNILYIYQTLIKQSIQNSECHQ